MFAYDCLNPIALTDEVDGSIYECTSDDLDELTEFEAMFHEETGVDKTDYEGYRKLAQEHIDEGNLYFWKNAEGKNSELQICTRWRHGIYRTCIYTARISKETLCRASGLSGN